jgi:hypothetical protein
MMKGIAPAVLLIAGLALAGTAQAGPIDPPAQEVFSIDLTNNSVSLESMTGTLSESGNEISGIRLSRHRGDREWRHGRVSL